MTWCNLISDTGAPPSPGSGSPASPPGSALPSQVFSHPGYGSLNHSGNFRQKKLFPGRRNRRNKRSGCPRNRKLSEFSSEPFRKREKCSEFRTVDQKTKQAFGIWFRIIPRKRKQLGVPFRGTKLEANFLNFATKHSAEEKALLILY